MRRFNRETAAAFGDEPDRDIEADFGAATSPALTAQFFSAVKGAQKNVAAIAAPVGGKLTVAAPKKAVSGSVAVQAPKLAVLAPPAAAPKAVPAPAPGKPAAPAVKAAASGKVSISAGGLAAPTVSQKAANASLQSSVPVNFNPPTVAKPTSSYASNANQANFIDGGSTPIVSTVQAPARTAAQIAADKAKVDAAARARVKAETLAVAESNAAYLRTRQAEEDERAKTHAYLLANDPSYAAREKAIGKAGLDTAQITMGAKVLATGAAVIASGGAVAGAIGLTAGAGSLGAAVAADRLVAAVEKGGELGKQAQSVIADVKAAAAKGDKVASAALGTLDAVAGGRIAAGVKAGVEQALSSAGAAAANAVAGVAASLSGAGALNVSAAMSAAAGKTPAPASSVYSAAAALRPTAASSAAVSTRPVAAQLTQFDFDGEPRWLVTPEGRIVDLERTPSKATAKGFLVTTEGEVVKQ